MARLTLVCAILAIVAPAYATPQVWSLEGGAGTLGTTPYRVRLLFDPAAAIPADETPEPATRSYLYEGPVFELQIRLTTGVIRLPDVDDSIGIRVFDDFVPGSPIGPPFRAPAGPPADGIQFTLSKPLADGGARTLRLGFGDAAGTWLSNLALPTDGLPKNASLIGWLEISNVSCTVVDGRPQPVCVGLGSEFGEITKVAGPFSVPEPGFGANWIALLAGAARVRLQVRPVPS